MKRTSINLIPDIQNPSPDYYCTWQTQLYATSDGKPEAQRQIISEKALFEAQKPFGWAYFYEKARHDLFLVMDDSWDVPLSGDNSYYGSLILNNEKFPGYTLKELSRHIKELGWKGLGGWICAQESEHHQNHRLPDIYWRDRLSEAHSADISYWKVDWGTKKSDTDFRKKLTDSGKVYAPNLLIEHAVIKDAIPYSDIFRTYDVPAIMSIPMTMEKLADVLSNTKGGLINCEDEAYIAAAGGFTMGIMRHPYTGALPDGKADMSFPEVHRNLKSKMYEILRAARWHRIAPAFELTGAVTNVSDTVLSDHWDFRNKAEEIEEWWFENKAVGDFTHKNTLTKSATAFISRNTSLPEILPDENGLVPFAITSKNPNGAFSVCTCGRTISRDYFIPKCDVCVDTEKATNIGIFGEYNNLILENQSNVKRVLMQDLAGESAYDITGKITTDENKLIIPGALIHKIGTSAQPEGDTSEPGVIIRIVKGLPH